jgi:hypothetical protein
MATPRPHQPPAPERRLEVGGASDVAAGWEVASKSPFSGEREEREREKDLE